MAVGVGAIAGILAVGAVFAINDDQKDTRDDVPGGQPTAPADDLVSQPAPIVDAGIDVAESYPPQYILGVKSAQPDGCHKFEGHEVVRDGNSITVTVTNTVPADLTVVLCTMQYSETDTSINLGSDFESGETYTVVINGEKTVEFVAQ